MSAALLNEGVQVVEDLAGDAKVRAIVQDELAKMGKKQKCYLAVAAFGAMSIAGVWAFVLGDYAVDALIGGALVPLFGALREYC